MSLLDRLFKPQQRTVESTQLLTLLNTQGLPGKNVLVTPKKSISLGVVFECIDIITRTLSLVSPKIMEERNGGKYIATNHPYYNILTSEPYPLYDASKFYQRLAAYYLLFGNAYARIQRDNIGRVIGLKLYEDADVDVSIIEIDGIENHWYKIQKTGELVNQMDMIHIYDFTFDGVKGISRIMSKKNTIQNAGNIQNYTTEMYQNGANISGYIYGDRIVEKGALDYVRKKFEETYTSRNGGIAALPPGYKYEPLQYNIPFADASIIEANKFTVEDIARIFGVPLSLLGRGESADNKGDREYNTFLSTVIAPMTLLIENEINRKVLMNDPNYYLKFELKGVYRTDMLTRYQAHQIGLNSGFMNKDEVRNIEGMNPIEGGYGATYYQQLNTIPLNQAEEYFENIIENNESKEINNDATGV
jgi:HK97 family phage portal protein